VTGYAEIEIGLMHCVSNVRDDLDTALKIMFRDRGETRRINVADAFGRQYYGALNLGTEFAMAVGAARYCLRIRNQFAHSNLYDDRTGQLAFVDLEELAKLNEPVRDLTSLTRRHVDVPLLQQMETYFIHTDGLIAWVNYEGRKRDGKLDRNPLPKPQQIAQPPLYLP
jgi:hypothetical protein